MNQIGPLLKTWRGKRRLSQLDLALEAGVSTRHLSFVETGRSRPSEQMVLHLAEQLEVPLRERNRMLLAAGYAPVYAQRALDEPELGPIKDALDQLLESHEPFPAIVVDRGWNLVAANRAIEMLTAGAADAPARAAGQRAPARPAPGGDGAADRQLRRVARAPAPGPRGAGRQPAATTRCIELHDELKAYPGEDGEPGPHDVFVPLRIRGPEDTELRFLSTRTTFATAVDVTVSELAIESFFPADAADRGSDPRLRRVEVTLEQVEPVGPVAAVGREPAIDLGQRRRIEPVPAPLRVDPHPHEPGLAQHAQVLGDAGLAQPELAHQLAHGALALAQQIEDPPPARIGEHIEDGGHDRQYDR